MMTLTEFLISIAQDPNEQAAYEQDPVAYIEGGSISPAHKFLLRNAPDQTVMDEIAFEASAGAFTGDPTVTSVTTTFAGDPSIVLRSFAIG